MDTTSTHNARYMAISRVRNSLIRSLLFHSKSLNLKSDSERFTLVAIQKRATVSKSLSQLFTKNRRQWFAHDLSKSLLKNRRFAKKIIFFVCFWQFFTAFPLFVPRANCSCRSKKEWPWANPFRCSLQNSDSQFIESKSLFCSQKRAICSKNQRANRNPGYWLPYTHLKRVTWLPYPCVLDRYLTTVTTWLQYPCELDGYLTSIFIRAS